MTNTSTTNDPFNIPPFDLEGETSPTEKPRGREVPVSTPWLRCGEAADYIRTSERTIRELVRRGELTAYRRGGNLTRFHVDDLDAFLRAGATTGPAG